MSFISELERLIKYASKDHMQQNKLANYLHSHADEIAELRNDAEIGSAIRMAAKDLPENFELEITVERGAASVYLRTPDEETVCIDVDSDNRLAAEIRNGIDRARSANERI